MYEDGLGTSQDLEKAHHWYSRSGNGGHSPAQFNLGLFYKYGKGSGGVDFEKATQWLERAANQSHYRAAVQLASLFDGPDATEEGNKKAFDWMLFAAELTIVPACCEILKADWVLCIWTRHPHPHRRGHIGMQISCGPAVQSKVVSIKAWIDARSETYELLQSFLL